MKFLIQRVTEASVKVDGEVIGAIDKGYLVLIGIAETDTKEQADKLLSKMIRLRIFEDENGKTNKSITDVGGSLLLVSQFTLYADTSHGNRPGFTTAGKPDMAEPLYEYIIQEAKKTGIPVATGSFGADMKISLVNDGPFTIMLESE